MYIDTFRLDEYYLVPEDAREWVASRDPEHKYSHATDGGLLFAEKYWLQRINEDPFFKLRKIFKRKGKVGFCGDQILFFNGALPKYEDLTITSISLFPESGRVTVCAHRDGSDCATWLSFSDFPLGIQEKMLNFIASL